MQGKLYEYNGQNLSVSQIATLENISRQTLQDWIDKTDNIYDAVKNVKESLKIRKLEYYGETLSLTGIARKEGLKPESLKKNFKKTNDIYKAVKLTKESKEQRKGSILYKGKKRTMRAIAILEDIERHALKRYYDKTKDIEEAVKLAKKSKKEHNGTIPYKGKEMTIHAIAKLENIKKDTLKNYYDIYDNIEKAVMITKLGQAKRKESLLKNQTKTLEEASKELNISTIRLNSMIESGISLDEIDNKLKENNRGKRNKYIKLDEETLFKYCLDNGLNYTIIYNMITIYNKTPEEAIKEYKKNGQKVPHKWIYEKYNVLLKHLFITFGIDSNRLIKTMRDNNLTLEQAVERIIFISYNNSNFTSIEIEWLYELYTFLKECNNNEYEEAKKTFFITENELNLLKQKQDKINEIKQQILLYEFSEILDIWNEQELIEMFELYNITKKDIETIVLDLYIPFNNKVINPIEEDIKRKKYINKIIKETLNNTDISVLMHLETLELTPLEKEYIITKRNKLKQLLKTNTLNNNSELGTLS